MSTPPMRNLPPMAEPWGRWGTEELTRLRSDAEALGANSSSDSRSNNSVMDNMSSQLTELYARQLVAVELPSITIAPTAAGGAWTTRSSSIAAPSPVGGSRYAYVHMSAQIGVAGNANDNLAAFELRVGSTIMARYSISLFGNVAMPPGFQLSAEAAGSVVLGPSDVITLTMYMARYAANQATLTLDAPKVMFSVAQKA